MPVVCTLQGEDTYIDAMPEIYREQVWELLIQRAADVDLFIAVSHYYADVMKNRMRLSDERVRVVYNGITLDGYEPAGQRPSRPVLGYLARL